MVYLHACILAASWGSQPAAWEGMQSAAVAGILEPAVGECVQLEIEEGIQLAAGEGRLPEGGWSNQLAAGESWLLVVAAPGENLAAQLNKEMHHVLQGTYYGTCRWCKVHAL